MISAPLLGYLVRRCRRAGAICFLLPVLLGAVFGLIWPEFRQQLAMAKGLLSIAKSLFGSEYLDLASPAGFFQIPFAHPLTVFALLIAIAVPTLSLPAAARDRWLDPLLATGVTRRQLVVTVAAAALPFALLQGIAPLIGTYLGARVAGVVQELPFDGYLRVALEAALLAFFFIGLATLLSVTAPDFLSAVTRLFGAVLASLLCEITGTLWQAVRPLKYLSPYGYFEPAQVIAGVAHYGRDCGVLLAGGLLFLVIAVVVEERRRSA